MLPTRPDLSVDYEAADAALLLVLAGEQQNSHEYVSSMACRPWVSLWRTHPQKWAAEISADTIRSLGLDSWPETADIAAACWALQALHRRLRPGKVEPASHQVLMVVDGFAAPRQ